MVLPPLDASEYSSYKMRTSELLTSFTHDRSRWSLQKIALDVLPGISGVVFPDLAQTIDPNSIHFLQQEQFSGLTSGKDRVIDLLVEVRQAEEEMAFLVHLEAQASTQPNFTQRMFFYFARLYQRYLQKVYQISECTEAGHHRIERRQVWAVPITQVPDVSHPQPCPLKLLKFYRRKRYGGR